MALHSNTYNESSPQEKEFVTLCAELILTRLTVVICFAICTNNKIYCIPGIDIMSYFQLKISINETNLSTH